MSVARASSTYSATSDAESLMNARGIDQRARAREIASRSDFYIFTSLLWIRRADEVFDAAYQAEELKTTPASEEDLNFLTPDESQPDLGLLRLHRERLVAAAEALRWMYIPALERTENSLNILRSSIAYYLRYLPKLPATKTEYRKLRLMINKAGVVSIDSTIMECSDTADISRCVTAFLPGSLEIGHAFMNLTDTNQKNIFTCNIAHVFIDSRPTYPSTFTTHKTSQRTPYNAARKRAHISSTSPTEKEVVLYNTEGQVMEASLCTVYFLRNGTWITPATTCGGNAGVTRRLAVEKGLCQEGIVDVAEIEDGEMIWLSNAARGFFMGRICSFVSTYRA